MKRMMFIGLLSFWMLSGVAFAHQPGEQKRDPEKRDMSNQCTQMMEQCCPTKESREATPAKQAWQAFPGMQGFVRGIQRIISVPVLY
jgi:hypothetical protein